ncbi:nucleoside deaminase [Gemmatimonas sp. UBA7669]|uniref:nucleoside deaminase n=1 Tax=Gemmatimonas sp. UBA7669 TaxID=1946568 RepID=UPI0025C34AA8|nr:nucleoside deaminase [Gemmatimonas sp. UBA7669]
MNNAPLAPGVLHAMHLALAEAKTAAQAGEVPVGAVIIDSASGEPLLSTQNRMKRDGDATSHAEVLALRAMAAQHGDKVLSHCTLVVTLEPCAMCAGAIVLSRVGRVVFGAWDDKAGMCGSVGDIVRHPRLNHRPEVRGGVLAEESGALLRAFFESRR